MDASIPLDDIKLLLKISNNIITQPNIQKYQNIRLTSLHTKLKNYDGCILVLCDMGFRSSFDEKRLIFDCTQSNIKKMKWFNMVWTRKLNSATTTSITNEFCRPFEPTKSQDEIDSDYFHKKEKWTGFKKCVLTKCLCLNHIVNALIKYKSYIQLMQNEPKNRCIISDENSYLSVNLLDDFNHLLQAHSHQFEDIYNFFNKHICDNNPDGCKLSDCLLIKRHQRDRNKKLILSDLYFNNNHIVEQQLLDRIHCHYFHSFDVGYKMTEKQKENIIGHKTK
eukprot:523867_1